LAIHMEGQVSFSFGRPSLINFARNLVDDSRHPTNLARRSLG
jgi:hypothetical protein